MVNQIVDIGGGIINCSSVNYLIRVNVVQDVNLKVDQKILKKLLT